MKPGDLIKVGPSDSAMDMRRVVLTKTPEPFSPNVKTVGQLEYGEVGLLVALVLVEDDSDGWRRGGKRLEACVLFGEKFGWNNVTCFSEVL